MVRTMPRMLCMVPVCRVRRSSDWAIDTLLNGGAGQLDYLRPILGRHAAARAEQFLGFAIGVADGLAYGGRRRCGLGLIEVVEQAGHCRDKDGKLLVSRHRIAFGLPQGPP